MTTGTIPPGRQSAAALSLDLQSCALLILLSLLWGGSFLFMRVAGEEIPVLTLVFLRVALAALALHAVIIASGRRYPASGRIYGRALVMGVVNNAIPFTLIVFATVRIGAGAAAILNAMTPIFTVLLAHLLTADEKMNARKMTGVLLGFAGVAVMIGLPALQGLSRELIAALAMLGATTAYGLSAVIGKGFREVDPVVASALQLTASSLIMAPIAFAVDAPLSLPMPSWPAIFSTLAFALFSTALAYVLFFRILARAGGTNVALVTLLVPVSAVALGAFFLGERFGLGEIAGMALIGAGLLAMDGRVLAALARRSGRPGT
ncbi:DMT family transporter [Afifella pfennigii]|uniref:DMT family transporter n=1 Tax=Afifella pfennigii TaxID=209897 RepID=UPI0006909394|nr:DMT family transporter [Afifella pfennigii]